MSISLPSRPTRKLLVSLLPEIAGFVIAGSFAHVGSDVSLKIVLPVLAGAIILAIVAEYYITYKPLINMRKRELSTFLKEYLRLVEQEVDSLISEDANVRANIMLLKPEGALKIGDREFLRYFGQESIQPEYVSDKDKYEPGELDLKFEIGQGCCGRVIEQNDQFVSVSPTHAYAWDSSWETTEYQNEVTDHLNVIIGTPIYRPSDENKQDPIGVFIIDSEDNLRDLFNIDDGTDLSDVNFKRTEIANKAIQHARNTGILL